VEQRTTVASEHAESPLVEVDRDDSGASYSNGRAPVGVPFSSEGVFIGEMGRGRNQRESIASNAWRLTGFER
jgi:hypothetical protein